MADGQLDTLSIFVNDKDLARTLRILLDNGGSLSTRQFLLAAKSNKFMPALNRAREKGLVKIKRIEPEGKGNHLAVNQLTGKGKKLAKLAARLGI